MRAGGGRFGEKLISEREKKGEEERRRKSESESNDSGK